eukprot:TRINITY_DN66221_c0_g1_i1.p1 TRINITY_DN66221_c0_g1~~TRINITY_DN66221_c0_g1_i1.p1  ORF type:complete len:193 (+),score=31.49 TRINITY_DN66221_c0_g1_i1:41-619(+)
MSIRDTIEIIGGVHSGTKRLSIKNELERYGEIDICHKVGDPIQHVPWIRFRDGSSAEKAIEAISRGEVLIDGVAIKAQWKERKKNDFADDRKGHSSRDLFLAEQERRSGGGGGGRDRSPRRGGGGGGSRALLEDTRRDDRGGRGRYDDRDRYDDRRRDDRDDRRRRDYDDDRDDRRRSDDRDDRRSRRGDDR